MTSPHPPCPIPPHYEDPNQHFFRPAFGLFNNAKITSVKKSLNWKSGPAKILIQLEKGNLTEKYSQLLIFAIAVLC